MKISIYLENEIIDFNLPKENVGNFWLQDSNGNNIVNIKYLNENWVMNSSENTKILDSNGNSEDVILEVLKFYVVVVNDKKHPILFNYSDDLSFKQYNINLNDEITAGRTGDISCSLPIIENNSIKLTCLETGWKIIKEETSKYYVNSSICTSNEYMASFGDVINLFGLKMLLGPKMIFINNPFDKCSFSNKLLQVENLVDDEVSEEEINNKDLYEENDYFLRSPRLRKSSETMELSIDPPPAKENIPETPLWVTLAPMLTMSATSLISLTGTIEAVNKHEKTLREAAPSIIIVVCMLLSVLVWPFVSRWFEKRRRIKREEDRQIKYKEYLEVKRKDLASEYDRQMKVISENLFDLNQCFDIITNKRRSLWERKIDHGDFLTVRVGIGQKPFNANIRYHMEDFKMEDDNLKSMCESLANSFKTLNNIPIGYSFADTKHTAISGIKEKYIPFINNVFLQMMAYHSYDNLKIVVLTSEANKKRWEYLKESPYCFTIDKGFRFFASTESEMQSVSDYLVQIYNARKNSMSSDTNITSYAGFDSYYLFLIDNINDARNITIIRNMLNDKINYGFGSIIIEERLSKIPSEVNNVITVGETVSVILNNETNEQVRFNNEINESYDMISCSHLLSNLPVFIPQQSKVLPNTVSFLEIFGVGEVEQLNILNRWKENDPTKSLRTEIGINENEGVFYIDLHEKQHGPHGLVAGMTGSGKSEFIISFVLSMAVNYSPEEVAFVLIDYKGGGLAGAFANAESGQVLPHVVGTITNLDKTEINRSLASIKSELTRRQQKFNEVRDITGENTIDIYKYQRYYRDGVVDEAMPHLIIVCDEFAELKEQQPDFMDDLVSTARIGRSLGVHLILATQKPSGVVDAQIWSNAKFKVCLKVQDRQDSMEMIKNELAAELKNVGRFYLQVGYNEYFAIGQSAYSGAKYIPNKEFKKQVDKNLYVIDNVGDFKRTINNGIAKKKLNVQGEELGAVLKYIIDSANQRNLNIRKLWKDKLPSTILLEDLKQRYNYSSQKYYLNPILGEYDDPQAQRQDLLTLPLSDAGNAIIYGMNDSGKDELLQTLVYSLISNYSSDELNMYLLDFGAETLINFANAPQVGDVVFSSDEEKIFNLTKLLNLELNDRKKKFIKYNGNYKDYIKLSGEHLPSIVVVINSIESMTEMYVDILDKFLNTIREGAKYGIYYVFTTESQNSVKLKVSQTCKLQYCLQMNNDTQYKDILGRTEGLIPMKCLGRGLFKGERVYEFQTASIENNDERSALISNTIESLNSQNMKKAIRIPTMPEVIELKGFARQYNGINNVPLGIIKENLNSVLYNFSKIQASLICANEMENLRPFINNFIHVLDANNTFTSIVIDACNYFEEYNYKSPLATSNFDKLVDALVTRNEKIQTILNNNNMNVRSLVNEKNTLCVILGFDKFFNKLSDDAKTKFKTILKDQKESLKITFVFVDIPSNLKKYEFEEFFKDSVNSNDGIWIGPGITQQFMIKLNSQTNTLATLPKDYGVVVNATMPTIFKVINEIKVNKM